MRATMTFMVLTGSLLALPAVFAVATGLTVGAVERSTSLIGPLLLTALTFVGMQVLTPLHTAVSMNLGNQVSAYLNERLIVACVTPPGVGNLGRDYTTISEVSITGRRAG